MLIPERWGPGTRTAGEASSQWGPCHKPTPTRQKPQPRGRSKALWDWPTPPPSSPAALFLSPCAEASGPPLLPTHHACSHLRVFAPAVCFAWTTLVPDIYMVCSLSPFRTHLWPFLTILSKLGPSPNSPHFVFSIALFTIRNVSFIGVVNPMHCNSLRVEAISSIYYNASNLWHSPWHIDMI